MSTELRELLATHDGVITRAEARSVGMSSSAIGRRTTSGAWTKVGHGVYFASDRDLSDRARMRIVCASVGPSAVLSGPAALWWHGLAKKPPRSATVTVPRGCHPAPVRGGVVVHRDLHDVDIIERASLRVCAIPLAVLDAAAGDGSGVIDSALLRGRVSLAQLFATHERYPGRRGAGEAARMLRAAASGARSEAERVLHGLLRAASIVGWVAGYPTCGYVADLAFPELKLLVEIDGYAFHSDAETFQYDRTRQNVLVAAGWTVLRFTWQDLIERPQQVIAEIRAAMSAHR